MKRNEVITAGVFVLMAVVAMVDSLKKAGWTASGPDAGWYPFWSALMMGIAAAVVFVSASRKQSTKPFFQSAEGTKAFWQLAIPMVIMVGLINWLGFYIVSALYLGMFARWIGRYHWVWVAALAISIPLALYLGFEQAFQAPMPKSMFYNLGLLSF